MFSTRWIGSLCCFMGFWGLSQSNGPFAWSLWKQSRFLEEYDCLKLALPPNSTHPPALRFYELTYEAFLKGSKKTELYIYIYV